MSDGRWRDGETRGGPCRPGSPGPRALLSHLSLGPDPTRIGFCSQTRGASPCCPGWRTGSGGRDACRSAACHGHPEEAPAGERRPTPCGAA